MKKHLIFILISIFTFNISLSQSDPLMLEYKSKRKELYRLYDEKESISDSLWIVKDSLKDSFKKWKRQKMASFNKYFDSLKAKMFNDSIQHYIQSNFPLFVTRHKKISNSDGIIFKRKEPFLITNQIRRDDQNHEFFLTDTLHLKYGWFKAGELSGKPLESFSQVKKSKLNNLLEDLKIRIEVKVNLIHQDSLNVLDDTKTETFSVYGHPSYININDEIERLKKEVGLLSDKVEIRKQELQIEEIRKDRLKRLRELELKYGKSVGSRIFGGEIWIGMTEEMVFDSIGYPQKTNKSVYPNLVKKQLVYEGSYIYLENGIVTSYQETY